MLKNDASELLDFNIFWGHLQTPPPHPCDSRLRCRVFCLVYDKRLATSGYSPGNSRARR